MNLPTHWKTPCRPLAALLAGVIILGGCWPAFAGTLTLKSSGSSATPAIIGYNHGHFNQGGNAGAWWQYAGVNGVRIFISPSTAFQQRPRAGPGHEGLHPR